MTKETVKAALEKALVDLTPRMYCGRGEGKGLLSGMYFSSYFLGAIDAIEAVIKAIDEVEENVHP